MKNELLTNGNLIQVNGELGIIRQIDDKKAFVEFRNRKCDVSRDAMEGVKVETESLKRLGYEERRMIGVFESEKGDIRISIEEGICEYYDQYFYFNYLHQLQNLIHSITGKKLEVVL